MRLNLRNKPRGYVSFIYYSTEFNICPLKGLCFILLQMSKSVKRLFRDFQPEHYELSLHPDADKMTFSGTVIITGRKTGRPSQRITLHQKDLKVATTKLEKLGKDKKTFEVDRINTHNNYHEVRLHSKEMLFPGEYRVTLEFSGIINDQMHGLYPCYFEHEGKKKKLLATQFESHHAREVFPCIDEPEAKATFDLTLTTQKDEVVLGNTPIKSQSENSGKLVTTFERSPRMSTYLLAFVTGEMHAVEAKTKSCQLVRTWGTVAQPLNFMQYANDEAVKVLEFFEEYFDTPFPLPKVDQVALPDFESGAMENWGLITYREIALLADPKNRSLVSEQYVSMVVAHELSHQWFGNLVTMKWWDDLWLNESFASLMEHVALDKLHPDWHQWEQYVTMDVLAASNRDIYKDVQPVRVAVNHPDEIHSLFDPAIVYAKGGRLLKMLLDYVGEDAFRRGLKTYFTAHAYKNTTRDDLWTEISKSSGKDINALMDPWLEQSGMPVISVEQKDSEIELSQKRFVLDEEKSTNLWPVPLLATPKMEQDLLDTPRATVNTSKPSEIILNTSGSGHYITNYISPENKAFIAQSIAKQSLQPESRINILNDQLLLARRGDNSIVDSLRIIEDCADEPRDAVWALICRTINLAQELTEGDKSSETTLHKLRVQLAQKQFARLGWEDSDKDDANTKHLRHTMVALMTAGQDKETVDEALKKYKAAKNIEDLPADYRSLIVGTAVRNHVADIENLIKQYKTSVNPDVQNAITAGLCRVKDEKTAQYILESALGKNGFVRPQDIFRWYAHLMQNRHTRELAWDWLTTSWERLEGMYGDSKSFDHFVTYSAGPLNTPEWQQKFVEFFTPKLKVVALHRNITVAFSEIEARVAWRKRDEPKIRDYLS